MAFWESTQRHEISGERRRRTQGERKMLKPLLQFSCHLRQKCQNRAIWESDMMLPWTTALKLLWRLPFWKGWDFRRLICCWITLGDFWLAQSRPGHTAAVSGDGGLKQMAWPNQGESAVVRSRVCVPEFALVFDFGYWNVCGCTSEMHVCVRWYLCVCA